MIKIRFINHTTGEITEDAQGIADILTTGYTEEQKKEFYRDLEEHGEKYRKHFADYLASINKLN